MPQLSFTAEFADMVASGKKCQTIRAPRKDGRNPKPGDTLYLKSGPYKGKRRDLGVVTCTSVRAVAFNMHGALSRDGIGIMPPQFNQIALADGFEDMYAMVDWFKKNGGLPFEGYLIKWNPERGAGGGS